MSATLEVIFALVLAAGSYHHILLGPEARMSAPSSKEALESNESGVPTLDAEEVYLSSFGEEVDQSFFGEDQSALKEQLARWLLGGGGAVEDGIVLHYGPWLPLLLLTLPLSLGARATRLGRAVWPRTPRFLQGFKRFVPVVVIIVLRMAVSYAAQRWRIDISDKIFSLTKMRFEMSEKTFLLTSMLACMQCDIAAGSFQMYTKSRLGFFTFLGNVLGYLLYVAICTEAWVTSSYDDSVKASWTGFLVGLILFQFCLVRCWWRRKLQRAEDFSEDPKNEPLVKTPEP